MGTVAVVHKDVHERTSEEEQPWQEAEEMRAVLAQQQEDPDRKEAQKSEECSTGEPASTSVSSRRCHISTPVRIGDRREWVEAPIPQGRTQFKRGIMGTSRTDGWHLAPHAEGRPACPIGRNGKLRRSRGRSEVVYPGSNAGQQRLPKTKRPRRSLPES